MSLRNELPQNTNYSALSVAEQDGLAIATLQYHNIRPIPDKLLPCRNESLYRCTAGSNEEEQFPSASLKVGVNGERLCMKFASEIPCDRYSPVLTLESVLRQLSSR